MGQANDRDRQTEQRACWIELHLPWCLSGLATEGYDDHAFSVFFFSAFYFSFFKLNEETQQWACWIEPHLPW